MKNKKLIALIAILACFVVLLVVLVGCMVGKPEREKPGDSETSGTVQEQPESNEETPEPNGTSPDPGAEDEKEEPEKKPEEKEEQPDELPGSSKKLNPNPATKDEIEAVLNDPFMILVNRDHKVSSDYKGFDMVTYSGDYKLNKTCADALRRLIDAGKNAGYSYTLYSGYRSYSSQYNKYYNKIAYWKEQGHSEEEAIRLTDQYYAPPGASEHHTGLAADVCIPEIVNKYACLHENYDQTEEFKWFSAHAHEYGFILRYRKGDEDITGYSYEPWHYRYVGVEIATEIYKRDITFEEYVEDLQARLAALS